MKKASKTGAHRGHNDGTISKRTYTKKDGTKCVMHRAFLPADDFGKRTYIGSFKTRSEASAAIRRAIVDQAQGHQVSGKVPRLDLWLDTWMASRTGLAYNTRRNYVSAFKAMRAYIGQHRLDVLSEEHIAGMWRKLAEGEAPDGSSQMPLGATTLGRYYVYLNAALRAAVKSRTVKLAFNPCDGVKPERGERKEIYPITED